MKYEKYSTQISNNGLQYDFISNGPNGPIFKTVRFKEDASLPSIYNLVFGNLTEDIEVDTLAVSDNKDTEKILATVEYSIRNFLELYPDKFVFFAGSTRARTRLYRMMITKNYDGLTEEFNVYCRFKKAWRIFRTNSPCDAFIITRK